MSAGFDTGFHDGNNGHRISSDTVARMPKRWVSDYARGLEAGKVERRKRDADQYAAILDVVKAHHDRGTKRSVVVSNLLDLAADALEPAIMKAVREVYDA